jgi:hypothetical protein
MLPYGPSDLKKGVSNPSLIVNELKIIKKQAYKQYSRIKYNGGFDVMGADWDNLIILDACRYDKFKEEFDRHALDGELEKVLSKGTASWEFMRGNWVDGKFHDTVYVTGNAHTSKLDDDTFHAISSVEIDSVNQRDTPYPGRLPEESGAILPEDVVAETIAAYEKFPQKRLVSHFMQPHLPFLGEYGRELYERVLNSPIKDEFLIDSRWGTGIQIWNATKHPNVDIDDEDIKKAYIENLSIVLEYVKDLSDVLSGKTVITSDHGQLLGERILSRKRYGHPHDIHPLKLIEVPWLEINTQSRREIQEDPPVESERLDENEIKEHLQALGYFDEV